MTTDTERVPTIYECMGRILAELKRCSPSKSLSRPSGRAIQRKEGRTDE